MGESSTGFRIGDAPARCLHDVQVVQHVVQAAVVGQTVEQRANGVFGSHDNPASQEGDPSIRPSRDGAKFTARGTRTSLLSRLTAPYHPRPHSVRSGGRRVHAVVRRRASMAVL